jgi:ankyrin repeat protein
VSLRGLRASEGSLDVLNELLEYDGCDVDYTNNIEGATPLHLAVKIEEPELRALIVDSLLDAGADPL